MASKPLDPNPAAVAKRLRVDATEVEKVLWRKLRGRQLGFKFRRQRPMGSFVTDFCCVEAKLIVELDGEQHVANKDYDVDRPAFLLDRGYRVIRFWNHEITSELERVIAQISIFLNDPHRLTQ
jgi:very-short-patch-repair endonuclease